MHLQISENWKHVPKFWKKHENNACHAFFDDKCPCLANQFWEIHVQHRKMEQKHWKQRTVGPCFAMWSKNSNFLTFLRMEMMCFSCKKMHRIFQDSLRNAKNAVKYWKKQENDAIWAFFRWFEHKTATSTYATCPFSMIIFWIFPSKGCAYPST